MKRILLVVGIVLAAVSGAEAQTADEKWTPPRTPDGRPNLQGIWTTQTFTPLQRPARYADKEFLTEQEAADLLKLLTREGIDPLARAIFGATDDERDKHVEQTDVTHYNNAAWLTTPKMKTLSSRRTSLIIDPPDGKIPPLTAEGQKRAAARQASLNFNSYENRPLQERCVVWTHEGPPMLPPAYNDMYQIFQTPGYVVVFRELSTNLPRIIPTDGRPHLSAGIRQWAGDSRGRWEGDTLVVETTNFNDKTAFQGSTAGLHVVERFTRVSADRIVYQFTASDPSTWTKPWTAEIPMLQSEGRPYEYGCHEGNYGVVNILKGARAADRKAGHSEPAQRR